MGLKDRIVRLEKAVKILEDTNAWRWVPMKPPNEQELRLCPSIAAKIIKSDGTILEFTSIENAISWMEEK